MCSSESGREEVSAEEDDSSPELPASANFANEEASSSQLDSVGVYKRLTKLNVLFSFKSAMRVRCFTAGTILEIQGC